MRVHIVMSQSQTHPRVFKKKTDAHKYIREELGMHPIGCGFWGWDADLRENEHHIWIHSTEVRE